MSDNFYRSYSLEKSETEVGVAVSGTLTTWEDAPVSPLEVGDTFRPVPDGPLLTVKKVNINDNVIGSKDGKPFRLWQISIEGNNEDELSSSVQANILYNFNFNAEEHSGTMEVTNSGKAPAISLKIGDKFNVPGIGNIPCVNVRGNDAYDELGNHIWTVVYEGSDASSDEALPEVRYNFSIDPNDDDTVHSGSMQVVNEGNAPSLSVSVGSTFNVPGIGNVTCTKVSGSDDYSDSGKHIWTVTYEGSNAPDDEDEALPQVKYNFSIDSSDAHSGSMQVVNEGSSPAINLMVGSTFDIPGLGNVTCTNISGSDDYTDAGTHRWTVTYEGSDKTSDSTTSSDNNDKYTFSVEVDDDGETVHSGTKQVISFGESPSFDYNVGDNINIKGIVGSLKCIKYSGSDEYTEDGKHKWIVTYECSDAKSNQSSSSDKETLPPDKYNISIEKGSDGKTQKSGSIQVVNEGATPDLDIKVDSEFTIPGIGKVKCTKVSGSDDYTDSGKRRWTMTYEGYVDDSSSSSGGSQSSDSDNETKKYNYSIEKGEDGKDVYSGSVEIITVKDKPPSSTYGVGSKFTIPGLDNKIFECVKVSGSDSYNEDGKRQWVLVCECVESKDDSSGGSSSEDKGPTVTKRSFSIEKNSDGVTIYSGSQELSYDGKEPKLGDEDDTYSVGKTFTLPVAGTLTCTKISGSDDNLGNWTCVIEGSRTGNTTDDGSSSGSGSGSSDTQPKVTDISISYELNGSTARTIEGNLVILRRSEDPICRKTLTVYSSSESKLSTPGNKYQDYGIALSESIVKETVKVNNVEVGTQYKHTIEVEA